MSPAVRRALLAGLSRSRGTADRAVRAIAPLTGRLADAAAVRIRRVRRTGPVRPETFAPAPPADGAGPTTAPGPSPATVARNIAPRRPSATPARRRSARPSVPGAKLPPPRTT